MEDLSHFNVCLNEWITEAGVYKVLVGTSSRDIIFSKEIFVDTPMPYTMKTDARSMVG